MSKTARRSSKPVRRPPVHVGSRIEDGQPSPYLSLHQVAAEIHVSVTTLRRLIHTGQFAPFTRLGRAFVFRREAIEAWLRSRESMTGIAPHKRTRKSQTKWQEKRL